MDIGKPKTLRVTIEYGEMMFPPEAKPFIDSGNTQVIEMVGDLRKFDGGELASQILNALGVIARDQS